MKTLLSKVTSCYVLAVFSFSLLGCASSTSHSDSLSLENAEQNKHQIKLGKPDKNGDISFRIPHRASGILVVAVGGGGGGGNINPGGDGKDTTCCGIPVARGAKGANASTGGSGDSDHFAGGDGGNVGNHTYAQRGTDSESFLGGSIIKDAFGAPYSGYSDGGGGGASSYSAGGAGGYFGGWPPSAGARPGKKSPGPGAGGGGAYCITWGGYGNYQNGGGGGAGCKAITKFIPRSMIKNPDEKQICHVGKGGAGAAFVNSRADAGGDGGDGVIYIFAVY